MEKIRADALLFAKGLVNSKEKGKRFIMEGSVFIGEKRVDKPGEKINTDSEIYIKDNPLTYVSRGGLKLEKAINEFDIDLQGVHALDIGASTGGFTDCMLQNGAKKVYAIDVGYGQLDWGLRNDPRVVVMERTNVRYVNPDDFQDKINFISIDVSFISLKLVLPVAKSFLDPQGQILALIKPQFEAGREKVGKKGIIKDKSIHQEVLKDIIEFTNKISLGVKGVSFSPITGSKGNIEFLLYLINEELYPINDDKINSLVDLAHKSLK